jgi:endonuclease/exonuclease/phosphatase family metal-dependent hydrolase
MPKRRHAGRLPALGPHPLLFAVSHCGFFAAAASDHRRLIVSEGYWAMALIGGWKVIAVLVATTTALALPDLHRPARGSEPAETGADLGRSPLSVMTYNIEGLPWPVRFGRDAAFDAIAAGLRDLREQRRQPHVVLLQEAFVDDARAIGAAAGYRYVVDGPDAATRAMAPVRSPDPELDARRSFWKGEASGKLVGSGLQILSDYPLRDVKRAAFPAQICAGYDCIANKGMVMAIADVPVPWASASATASTPIAIVDVHLNSGPASGVSRRRAYLAFRDQIDLVAAFLRREAPRDMPVLLGGDFNIGRYPERRAYAEARLGPWLGSGHRNAFGQCLVAPDCIDNMSADAHRSLRHAKDWQFLRAGPNAGLHAEAIATPFGHDADGWMLSDHIGYMVSYRLQPKAAIAHSSLDESIALLD